MFPQTTESWILLGVAGVVGFLTGQWIKKRRDRAKTLYPTAPRTERHTSKKSRRKANRLRKAPAPGNAARDE